jgi:hypothetical protein
MISRKILSVLTLGAALALSACGTGDGVELGPFPDIVATEGDANINLTPPTSKSPARMTITSSNASVATVSADYVLTVVGPGQATLTASQPEAGSFNPTSKTALITVKPLVCTAPAVKIEGKCVTPK